MLWARTGVRPCAGTLADLGSRPDQTALRVSGSCYGPRGPEETCESGQDSAGWASPGLSFPSIKWGAGAVALTREPAPDSDGSGTYFTGALLSLHWDQGQAGGLLSPSQASLRIGAGDKGSPWGLGIRCWLPRGLGRPDPPPSIITRALCFFFPGSAGLSGFSSWINVFCSHLARAGAGWDGASGRRGGGSLRISAFQAQTLLTPSTGTRQETIPHPCE